MTAKEFIDGCLISFGIAGGASIVRAIFVQQEGSAWEKFIKFSGSIIFGHMVGVIIMILLCSSYINWHYTIIAERTGKPQPQNIPPKDYPAYIEPNKTNILNSTKVFADDKQIYPKI